MKVYIGNYPTYRSLYLYTQEMQYSSEDNKSLVSRVFNSWNNFIDNHEYLNKWFMKIANPRDERLKYVKIDNYDTWNFDSTLALIVAPALKLLKETKHGSPYVDDDDVPEEIKSTNAKPKENDYDVDEFHHDRWNYVLNEMIFAFESINTNWESKFHSGNSDLQFVALDDKQNELPEGSEGKYYKIIKGPNDTSKFDSEGYELMANRIKNGFRLFGKYYMNLWS